MREIKFRLLWVAVWAVVYAVYLDLHPTHPMIASLAIGAFVGALIFLPRPMLD